MFAIIYTSPALWGARYHIATVALFMALLAWASGRRGWSRLAEGIVAISFFSSLTGLWWGMRWWIPPSGLKKLASIPYPEREVTPTSEFAPDSDPHTGSCVTREAGLARERELGPGSVLAFPDNFGNFMSLFWNDHFSNRIVYLHEATFLADAEAQNATWLYCNYSDPNYARLKEPGSHWEQVAPLNVENWGAVFRRKKDDGSQR
jgi:hypothetical protein